MTRLKLATVALLVLTLGGSMTQPTPNDLDLNLPNAVQGIEESPVIMRVGTVVDIAEADNITVAISGSPVLVTASYLFPEYQPVLGDRVVTIRQDAQWFVFGTMAGPINSVAPNASFENGVVGSTPTDWTFTVTASAAGTPTGTKDDPLNPVDGLNVALVQLFTITGTGLSEGILRSTPVPASPGERWTAATFFRTGTSDDNIVAGLMNIEWLDAGLAIIGTSLVGGEAFNSVTPWFYLRPAPATASLTAPVGTVYVRVAITTQFLIVDATPLLTPLAEYDRVVLRRLS